MRGFVGVGGGWLPALLPLLLAVALLPLPLLALLLLALPARPLLSARP